LLEHGLCKHCSHCTALASALKQGHDLCKTSLCTWVEMQLSLLTGRLTAIPAALVKGQAAAGTLKKTQPVTIAYIA